MGYCVRKDRMLKVDILLGFFPDWLKKTVDIVARFVTLFFFAYLCYWGFKTAQNQVQLGMKSAAMEWPMWVIYGSVFVGALIGTLRQIEDLVRYFTKKKEDEK